MQPQIADEEPIDSELIISLLSWVVACDTCVQMALDDLSIPFM